MAFDKSTRNRLARFVSDARRLIAEEFTEQFQSIYGISPKGEVTPLDRLQHLDEEGLATAAMLRERIDYLIKTHPDERDREWAAVDRLARELAFTVLNRLAAVRMAEARDLIIQSVGKGYDSKGFQLFKKVAGAALGDSYHCYRRYLFCLFDELAIDLGVLFDRNSPQAILFPREPALLELLSLINDHEIDPLWAEDETIGWIYQYYNDEAERKKMREESAAPRNSRELAVRNQFFTPRYVVEFLTDNTLGRIWYEMTRGQTRLKEQCRYLVRRPTEIFLAEGETAPETPDHEGLSQEEILKQPIHISHRLLKDPREIRLLDPACGSMHFGLYAFDLYEVIYEEAWDLGVESLRRDFPEKAFLQGEIPRLIIENNIHGIDIDPRAAQIAGLSLWLRAQRAWHDQGVKAVDRPRITRGNIVCAESMPGSPEMLQGFTDTLKLPVLRELVKSVFEKMELAGEAGSLLKIDEEIRSSIEEAKKTWEKIQARPRELFSAEELNKVSDQPELTALEKSLTSGKKLTLDFWESAEEQVLDALKHYSEQTESEGFQKRLFANDAARGFAFIDLCRKRYDVAVMNPPFGAPSLPSEDYIAGAYPLSKNDIYGCFIEAALQRRANGGLVAAITSRTWMFLPRRQDIRLGVIAASARVHCLADLGHGVLDTAMVETCAFCLAETEKSLPSTFIRLVDVPNDSKDGVLRDALGGNSQGRRFDVIQERFKLLPGAPFAYWISDSLFDLLASAERFGDEWEIGPGLTTRDNERFLRSPLEISRSDLGSTWHWFAKGGAFSPYYFDTELVLNYAGDGAQIKAWISSLGESVTTFIANQRFYFQAGFTYPRVTDKGFNVRVLRAGHIFAEKGISVFPKAGGHSSLAALAYLNSSLVQELLLLMAPSRSWEKTFVASLPALRGPLDQLEESAKQIVNLLTSTLRRDTTSNLFLGFPTGESLSAEAAKVSEFQHDSSATVRCEADAVSKLIRDEFKCPTPQPDEFQNDPWEAAFVIRDAADYTALVTEYFLGTVFGRWDIRYATDERPAPELPDPFSPLPVCPPGMLQGDDGRPLSPEAGRRLRAEGRYPLDVAWDGILVDDENHPEDIVARVRAAIEVIWKDRAEAIEQEACGILSLKTLRDYFRRPAALFADHLKRYSKSRRQAPIYWPLSTKSSSYTLWIYYHRLTDQTLHTCLADFLDPKIRKVQMEIDSLRESGRNAARLGELQEFLDELKDLHDAIEEIIKLPWKPNLNDGVLITAAPLWKLFRLPKWQKDLKACWEKLQKGDYDWAHLALSIWPDRVKKVCEKDRSIAIAHGLEHLCKVEPPKPKAGPKKKLKEKAEVEEIAD
jgi:hypothetical protein